MKRAFEKDITGRSSTTLIRSCSTQFLNTSPSRKCTSQPPLFHCEGNRGRSCPSDYQRHGDKREASPAAAASTDHSRGHSDSPIVLDVYSTRIEYGQCVRRCCTTKLLLPRASRSQRDHRAVRSIVVLSGGVRTARGSPAIARFRRAADKSAHGDTWSTARRSR